MKRLYSQYNRRFPKKQALFRKKQMTALRKNRRTVIHERIVENELRHFQ